MKDQRCVDCVEYRRCRDTTTSWVFFVIGLIATFAIRIVTLLMNFDPFYGKIAWYVGVGGFFLFFIYHYRISHGRSNIIRERNLVDKIMNEKQLRREDYDFISSVLCSLSSGKERMNYFFIFALSGIALVLAFYFDFIA